jgi:hypothetical protein
MFKAAGKTYLPSCAMPTEKVTGDDARAHPCISRVDLLVCEYRKARWIACMADMGMSPLDAAPRLIGDAPLCCRVFSEDYR